MHNTLLLALFLFAIFLFVVFNAVSRVFYKRRHGDKYHFYNMFPYEFNYPSVFKENPYGNFLFILGSFTIAVFYIVNPYSSIYKVLSLIFSIVFTMVLICLILMPLYYLKTHMVLSCLTMALSAVLPLFNLFLAFEQQKVATSDIANALCIVSIVYSALLGLIMFALVLNPKLTFRIYSEKTVDARGREILKRPKIIFLALTEWAAIFIYFLSPIGVLLFALL